MKTILSSRRHHYLAIVSVFLVTVALIAGMAGCGPFSQNLEIRTWYDLDAIRNNLSGHHILMNDLDSTTPGYEELASPTANQGEGWEPIGIFVLTHGFFGLTGTFDGQGYEIRDLFINRPEQGWGHVGLFGEVGGGIKDIGVVNVTVTGADEVGGLVGVNTGTLSNSYSIGSVTCKTWVGGLVRWNHGTVSNSYSTGVVTSGGYVGGLVGINHGTVSNSYSTGSVTGEGGVGGLVGWNPGTVNNSCSTGSVTGHSSEVGGLLGSNWGTVSDSYSAGTVIGTDEVGGLVGTNDEEGTVSNSYSTGSVSGNISVGGLVGDNGGNVTNSYSTGNVTGDRWVGGLVGGGPGTVSNSFWDTETSGQATSDGGIGKTTVEMQDIATFSGVGWNIIAVNPGQVNATYTWNIVDGQAYPFMSWQSVS